LGMSREAGPHVWRYGGRISPVSQELFHNTGGIDDGVSTVNDGPSERWNRKAKLIFLGVDAVLE
jgi:hypothetical protein